MNDITQFTFTSTTYIFFRYLYTENEHRSVLPDNSAATNTQIASFTNCETTATERKLMDCLKHHGSLFIDARTFSIHTLALLGTERLFCWIVSVSNFFTQHCIINIYRNATWILIRVSKHCRERKQQ